MASKLKPLALAIITLMPALAYAAQTDEPVDSSQTKSSDAADTAKERSEKATSTESSDGKSVNEISTSRPPNTLVLPAFPYPTDNLATWRFGVWRNWDSGKRWHTGIDFSFNKKHGGEGSTLVAASPDTVVIGSEHGGGVNNLSIARPNGDVYSYLHMNKKKVRKGDKLRVGQPVGKMGNAGTGAAHLHLEYMIPCNSGRVRFTGFYGGREGQTRGNYRTGGSKYTHSGSVLKSTGKQQTLIQSKTNIRAVGRYCPTDPTPYLPSDRVYKNDMQDRKLELYLGNSLRSQYNALYNPTPNLPLGAGAKAATKKIPNLPAYSDVLSPEQLAALKSGGVLGAMYGAEGGYDLDGQYMSYQMLMSFIPSNDGLGWASLPPPARPVSVEEMTPKEIIANISEKRFGNPKWEAAIAGLSSKALLTEYLLMTTEENFLKQQNSKLKNRVEFLLAGLTEASLFKYNKQIEALQIQASAEAVPEILDVKMQPMYGNYSGGGRLDPSMLPVEEQKAWAEVNKNDLNELLDYLAVAVTHGESKSYDAFNYGSSPCDGFSTTVRARAEDDRKGRAYVSESKLSTLHANRKPRNVTSCNGQRFAIGRYQFTPAPFNDYRNFTGGSYFANTIWTPVEQDRTARWRILSSIRKNLSGFILGTQPDLILAALDVHREWRSVGVPSRNKPPEQWTETTDSNTVNVKSNLLVVQALQGIADWHKKFGHLGKVTIDPVTQKLITPEIPSVYGNTAVNEELEERLSE